MLFGQKVLTLNKSSVCTCRKFQLKATNMFARNFAEFLFPQLELQKGLKDLSRP